MDDLIEAFRIFRKYGNPKNPTHCGHEALYINSEIAPRKVSAEDTKRLAELGFFVCGEKFMSCRFGYGWLLSGHEK